METPQTQSSESRSAFTQATKSIHLLQNVEGQDSNHNKASLTDSDVYKSADLSADRSLDVNVDESNDRKSESYTASHSTGAGEIISEEEKYILGLDIGTTTIRANIYDSKGKSRGSSHNLQQLIQPHPGWSEIDPERLVETAKTVIHQSIKNAGLTPDKITCMGITTLRGAFITWDSETRKPFHNLISWQDLRAADYVSLWNKSYTLRALNTGAKVLHALMRKKRHLAASVLKFMSSQVTMRLLWALDNIPEMRERAAQGFVRFGCIDTWLLWRLTGGKSYSTEYSSASSTGLFDPYQMEWSSIVCGLVNIPMSIFPEIKDTSGDFGQTDANVLGFEVPITSMIADQQAAMFGHCCFDVGDVKCTMGTGTFIDVNTGDKPHASIAGLYPLVGWKIGNELVFLAEGLSADTGNVIDWAQSMGFFQEVHETSDIAQSVKDSGGMYFVPAFSGLQAPFNDNKAVSALFGMKPTTTKAHVVRSVLEAVAFRFKALYETVLKETKLPFSNIRVDGGVANNDFIVQLMSDLVNQFIHRSSEPDLACLGAAYLAGLGAGVWKNKQELCELRKPEREFEPSDIWLSKYKKTYEEWENAVHRSTMWYP